MAKVMVSLAPELLERIDEAAGRRSLSRSAWLASAATRELERRDPVALAAAVERSERRFARSQAFEAADLVRAERDR